MVVVGKGWESRSKEEGVTYGGDHHDAEAETDVEQAGGPPDG